MANIGIDNNNPLNIRYNPTINWRGQTGKNRGFAKFVSMAYGYRAAIKNIQTYIDNGYNTIDKIINRWAPASDGNNPESYAKNVSTRTGLSRSAKIAKNDLATLESLALAMSISEIGTNYPAAAREAIIMLANEQGLTINTPLIDPGAETKESPGAKKNFFFVLATIAILGPLAYLFIKSTNNAKK